MLLDKTTLITKPPSHKKDTNQDMGVNICIAPQWWCVCWVVSADWVKTVKYNIHRLIQSESINTPQLILGVRGTSPVWALVLSGLIALLPSKATSAAPSSWLLMCPLTCSRGAIVWRFCSVEWGAHARRVSQLGSFSALKRVFLGASSLLDVVSQGFESLMVKKCRTIYLWVPTRCKIMLLIWCLK